jgi:hypothetical protein
METQTNGTSDTTQTTMPIPAVDGMPSDIAKDDVIRRNILREQPCKLTDEEFARVARQRALKEAERDELEEDLAREKKKRQDQIDDLEDEIGKMGQELRTGYQDRTVKCIEVFRKGADGVGYVHLLRTDTWAEVERRAANAHETQRHLKGVDEQPGTGGVLEEARKRQRSAQSEASDVPPTEAASDVPASSESSTEAKDDAEDKPKAKKNGKAKE